MKGIHKKFITTLTVIILLVLVIFCFYYFRLNKWFANKGNKNTTATSTTLTILIPNDINAYEKAMNGFTSDGGNDPSKTWTFIKKEIIVPYTTDIVRASAEAAAEQILTHGGPANATIAYFKVKDSIAYVLLDIDLDGWAGVSFSENQIHPLVENTLLQFPNIQSVKFNFVPGDSKNNIQ